MTERTRYAFHVLLHSRKRLYKDRITDNATQHEIYTLKWLRYLCRGLCMVGVKIPANNRHSRKFKGGPRRDFFQ